MTRGTRSPIVASWKFGAGKALGDDHRCERTLVFAMDRKRGIRSVVGASARLDDTADTAAQKFDVALGYRAGRIEMRLTDYSDNAETARRPLDATVTGPDGTKYDAILTRTRPGNWPGVSRRRGRALTISSSSRRAAALRPFHPWPTRLVRRLMPRRRDPSRTTACSNIWRRRPAGRLNPSPGELALSRPEFERTTSMSKYLIFAAMLLLIGEALVRRLTF